MKILCRLAGKLMAMNSMSCRRFLMVYVLRTLGFNDKIRAFDSKTQRRNKLLSPHKHLFGSIPTLSSSYPQICIKLNN